MVIISQAVICQVTCANQVFFNKQESADREKRNAHVRKWLFVAVEHLLLHLREQVCRLASHILKCRDFVILIHFIRLNVFFDLGLI